jgi:3-oxoacyl-[acyl-carrier protein] reductase
MDLQIANRVALVCGSSSGLGLAIATRLAGEGCRVALNGRHPARLDRAAVYVEAETGARPPTFVADVGNEHAVGGLVEAVTDALGPIDILLANAGGPPARTLEETDGATWQEALGLNLLSTINLCRAVIPGMRERGWGRIVCLTSVAAKQPIPGLLLSSTARAGVLGFVKGVANEISADGVTINTICPGYMRTERVAKLFDTMAAKGDTSVEEIERDLVAQIPAGRIGDPDELAATVAFMVSDHAGYMTGATIQVDGGYTRGIL